MAYTSSPYAPKARFEAARLVVKDSLRPSQVARMYGVHRATVGKWVKKFPRKHNQYGYFISTLSSAPNHHPHQTPDATVERIIELREKYRRCAPVIHAHLVSEGFTVSIRTVGRVLKREGLIRRKKQSRFLRSIYPRPEAKYPGDLVQMDTIHVVRGDGSRYYIYSLIDVFSRLAYAQYSNNLKQSTSYQVVKNAQKYLKYNFKMIQTDHGPEFRGGFTYLLGKSSIKLRHSRIRHPNDNAHVERFNRTLQEECFGFLPPKEKTIDRELKNYLEYYNNERLHLSLELKTPTAFVAKVLS